MNVVNTRISQRYDTLQNWQQRNPTLLDGELAVVATDNQTRFKIGDGQHAFNDLNFVDQLKLTTVSAFANILSVNSAAVGFQNEAGTHSLAAGTDTSAAGQHAVALGYKAAASANGAFVFNGDQNYLAQPYYDHGAGTFNVNAPLSDVYIADNDIKTALSAEGFVLSASISSELEDIPTQVSQLENDAGYITSAQVKPSPMAGYAEKSYWALNVPQWDQVGEPNVNTFISLKSSDNAKGVAATVTTSTYASWLLSYYNSTTFDSPIELKWGYCTSVYYYTNGRKRTKTINSNAWFVQLEEGHYVIKAVEGANYYVPVDSIIIDGVEHPVTYTESQKKAIATIDGQSGVITCARLSDTPIHPSYELAYMDELSAKADVSALNEVADSFSDYYTMSETSSASEISNALSTKAETSSLAQYLALSGGTLSSSAVIHFGNDWILSTGITNHKELKISSSNGQTWTFDDSGDPDGYGDGSFVVRDGDLYNLIGYKVDRKADLLPFAQTFEDYVENEIDRHIWNDSDEYSINDTVAYEGRFYRCSQATDSVHPPYDTDYWEEIPYQVYAQYNGFSMVNVTWEMLVALCNNGLLFPGMKYRITDYVTIVDQENCRSAEHPFDLIVTALTESQLDENARATIHDGDTYFNAFEFPIPGYSDYIEMRRVPLEAWELKYCIYNDKQRFAFADTTNGKGVIYWMKDEFNNEAPYDFKNVQFYVEVGSYVDAVPYRDLEPDEDDEYWTWCYTFNGADYNQLLGANEPYDFSCWHPALKPQVTAATGIFVERLNICESNSIGSNIVATPSGMTGQSRFLLPNIFHCGLTEEQEFGELTLPYGMCVGNKIGDASFNNSFGQSALFNRLGNDNHDNMFKYGCSFNSLDDSCHSNMIYRNSCYNTLGKNCSDNLIDEDCYHNTFGTSCTDNTLEYECNVNVFENNCYSNHIYYSSTTNKLENGCHDIRLLVGYSTCIKVEQGCNNITLYCSQSTYYGNAYKNVTIKSGVHDKTITDNNVNQSFCTTYQPANSQVIAI